MTSQAEPEPIAQTNPPLDADGAAARALAEAEARRRAREGTHAAPLPPELDGRPGPEPVRYGDWENRGIASDF